jgi:hypothetical protein
MIECMLVDPSWLILLCTLFGRLVYNIAWVHPARKSLSCILGVSHRGVLPAMVLGGKAHVS